MAGNRVDDQLERRARQILSSRLNISHVAVAGPGLVRSPAAQFEIIHPRLRDCSTAERQDRIAALPPGEIRAVKLELAAMTRELRESGNIRATADYRRGVVVVSSGRPPGTAAPAPGNENRLLAWAAAPSLDIDMVTPVVARFRASARKAPAAGRLTARRSRTGTAGRRPGGPSAS